MAHQKPFADQLAPSKTKSPGLRHRRAVDLILPPMSGAPVSHFDMRVTKPSHVIETIVAEKRTGCMRSYNDEAGSRAALLLFSGRVVGCIYGSRQGGDPKPTEPSLVLSLGQLALAATQVQVYDLPAPLVLSMASIFLSEQVEEQSHCHAQDYLVEKLSALSQAAATGCLVFSRADGDALLAFVCRGAAAGTFQVQDQLYTSAQIRPAQLFTPGESASAALYILPASLDVLGAGFGFSLE